MILPVILCVVLAAPASGHDAANRVMDDILMDMAAEVRRTRLDPKDLDSFQVKVKSNGLLKRHFYADFITGSLQGLGQLRRKSTCALSLLGSETAMSCFISLGSVRALINAKAKGDQPGSESHIISTSTAVTSDSLVLIKLQGFPNCQARLANLTIGSVTMMTSLTLGNVDLNSERFKEFINKVNDNLKQRLASTLRESYSNVLNRVAHRFTMPGIFEQGNENQRSTVSTEWGLQELFPSIRGNRNKTVDCVD